MLLLFNGGGGGTPSPGGGTRPEVGFRGTPQVQTTDPRRF